MDESKITAQIIEGLDASQKAMPSEAFLHRMEQVALAYSSKISAFSKQAIIGIAASFLVLLSVNIYAINEYNKLISASQTEVSDDSYNLIPAKSVYHEQN